MTKQIIYCKENGAALKSEPWQAGQQISMMWMPSGVHTICAGFRKGSIELTVQCDEKTVEAVQASLDTWREDRPKQEPFGCIEHREQEASFRVSASGGFKWNGDGVYLAAEPTTLGAENVNGRVHRSWSPSFTTDADYSKAKEVDGVLQFPEGVRGSQSNPARITGVDFCVGTLTNKPAFHSMNPVRAKEADAVTANTEKENQPRPKREQFAAELIQDVPDYTETELTCYVDLLEHGRSHIDAVTTLKTARSLESNHATEAAPTIDSIYSKHADDMDRVNAMAAKHGAVQLTAEDVFERHCVMTGVKTIKTSERTPEAILERIYARAGGNR